MRRADPTSSRPSMAGCRTTRQSHRRRLRPSSLRPQTTGYRPTPSTSTTPGEPKASRRNCMCSRTADMALACCVRRKAAMAGRVYSSSGCARTDLKSSMPITSAPIPACLAPFAACLALCWGLSSAGESAIPTCPEPNTGLGTFFSKKEYLPAELPRFANLRDQLPTPIDDDHPQWLDSYWKAWQLAFQNLHEPLPGSGFVSQYID